MKPWAHQQDGIDRIVNNKSTMLAFDMGCGKTATVLWSLDKLYANVDPAMAHPVLVICPKSVLLVWEREIKKHAALPYNVFTWQMFKGTIKQRTERLQQWYANTPGLKVIVINYESVWRQPIAKLIQRVHPWGAIVCDESHRIKGHNSKVSKFVGKLDAERKICLTGTPMSHSPLDIYGQYRFLNPHIFGRSFTAFRNRYAIMGGYHHEGRPVQVVGYQNQDELNDRFYRFAIRVKKDDVLDLPDVVHETIEVELTSKGRKVYSQLEDELIADVDEGIVTASNALARLLRLQQITSGAVNTEDGAVAEVDTSKADALSDLIEDLPPGEPVVVFARFRHDLDVIHEVARKHTGWQTFELSGRKDERVQWEKDGGVIAVQIQAGGVGVDFSCAAYCVYFSMGFSLGDYEQSLARVHRPGQTRKVTYYHIVAKKTVDVHVYKMLRERKQVIDGVLELYQETVDAPF